MKLKLTYLALPAAGDHHIHLEGCDEDPLSSAFLKGSDDDPHSFLKSSDQDSNALLKGSDEDSH
jgi:hypothetical protein